MALLILCACGKDAGKEPAGMEYAEIPQIKSSDSVASSQPDNKFLPDRSSTEQNEQTVSVTEDSGDGWADAEGGIADEHNFDSEQHDNIPAEKALASGNIAEDRAYMDLKSVNEMLVRQWQEELKHTEKEKIKKRTANKQNSGSDSEESRSGGKDYSEKTSAANKPRLRHIGLKDLYSSSGSPSLFGNADKGIYFLFDINPELANKKKLGDINIRSFAESRKRMAERSPGNRKKLQLRTFKSRLPENTTVRPYSKITEDNLCSVCLQHRDSQGRKHVGFYDHKIIVMRLKPGCPIPSSEEGMLGMWEGSVDYPHIIVQEYDCTKKVPVPKDMCTGWIKRYICK